jgi:ferredoxin
MLIIGWERPACQAADAAQRVSQRFQTLALNSTFRQGLLVFALFVLAVGLNAKKERFWCRYVCPLGALLGLFSRWNVFKVRVDMDKCIKCNLCTMHCQTQAVPYPNEKWRSAECVYCGTCASICPTAAIRELKIEEKTTIKIGSAWINKNRCIPFVLGRPCIVCEEHCPTSPKAIKFAMTETKLFDGTVATQKAPVIDNALCIGCGICENKCPVVDEPAIYITSVGEVRSKTNQLLLPLIGQEPPQQ